MTSLFANQAAVGTTLAGVTDVADQVANGIRFARAVTHETGPLPEEEIREALEDYELDPTDDELVERVRQAFDAQEARGKRQAKAGR
jgi:hypothetical protein